MASLLKTLGPLVAVGAVALAFAADEAPLVGSQVARLSPPAAPVYSKDATVSVHAPMSKAGYRAPVLVFVDRTREELQRATRLKLGTQRCPLEVLVGGKSDGDVRVLTGRLRDPSGAVRERIELPDPEAADLQRFRRAVCVALLRGWMVEQGGTDDTMRDLPAWLIDGLVRYMDRETRQEDVDRALLLWSRACLPPARELVAFDSVAASREPAVGAVLAGWFLEKRPAGNPFEALLRGAASGTTWSPEMAAQLLASTADAGAFDAALDLWFLAKGRQVMKPGVTTGGIARRFRSSLLLYSSDYGKSIGQREAWLTFEAAAARSAEPAVRAAALKQALSVRMAALGRDGTLLAVSDAYEQFLNALARGAKQGELARLLMEAERLRGDLERRTAQGEVLSRTEAARAGSAAE
jgi:hypothetical protein